MYQYRNKSDNHDGSCRIFEQLQLIWQEYRSFGCAVIWKQDDIIDFDRTKCS